MYEFKNESSSRSEAIVMGSLLEKQIEKPQVTKQHVEKPQEGQVKK